MLDNNTLIKVKNRSGGTVSYSVPEMHIERFFEKNAIKEVTMEELRSLSWMAGGYELLRDFLILNNKEAIQELIGDVEPEYYYSNASVEQLLMAGSLDELLDCLDFAPQGVLDIVKNKAIELEVPDMNKRKAIQEKLGVDVTKAIEIKEELKETKTEEPTKKRRTSAKKEGAAEEGEKKAAPKRKTAKPKVEEKVEEE